MPVLPEETHLNPHMKVTVDHEAGYDEAVYGMALSYKDRSVPPAEWWTAPQQIRAEIRAEKLAHKDGGHNKFLESIIVWLDVEAPRYWWSEADTYRLTTRQSESTMHTLGKRLATEDDFEQGTSIAQIVSLNDRIKCGYQIWRIKQALPEGYLQRRLWRVDYKTLRNIILQRRSHRLPHWQRFIEQVLRQVGHPELLPSLAESDG